MGGDGGGEGGEMGVPANECFPPGMRKCVRITQGLMAGYLCEYAKSNSFVCIKKILKETQSKKVRRGQISK